MKIKELRAISIKQPWLFCITDLEHFPKRIENRTWNPPQWLIGETIAFHASKGIDKAGIETAESIAGPSLPVYDMPRGAIVALGKIKYTIQSSINPWFFGPVGWVLDDITKLSKPIPCRGSLGFWVVGPDELAEINRQLNERKENAKNWGLL